MINNNSNLRAVLGPTNTGKTYYALDRMLSYKSGIFGFPLRLLARENYDKAVRRLGSNNVALITGEEKILPTQAKYFFCTVESMPTSKLVDFIAIDEIQLTSDFERGHIFTERILKLRGNFETIFLGARTIEKILKKLFSNIKIEYRERFSKLTYFKRQNISKLKPRTAIIAFNVDDVYSLAEEIRSHKGGAALVLGALSPRTRNFQVEMYENKNVNYMVATDAIGMGLNLNIEHIAFSSLKKYDGRLNRNLYLSEIGQIAGRAGRYKNDGTFGVTKGIDDIDPLSIEMIENHQFELIEKIYWRNADLDFESVSSLMNSLNKNPHSNIFIKKKNAEDEKSFRFLSNDRDVKKYLNDSSKIKILWKVCRIPDFQKLMPENYREFLKSIFINLMVNNNFLPDEWISKHVYKLDNINGDIDLLSKRIAYIRTWTYVSNQGEWIENEIYWQKITRNIEDKLSDELHNKLKNRFVDERGNFFLDKIKKGNILNVKFKNDNLIETNVGSIKGFNLKFNDNIDFNNSNLINNYAKKTVLQMIPDRIKSLINAPDDAFNLGNVSELYMDKLSYIYWGDDPVGYLEKGENIFSPKINVLNSDLLESNDREKILKRLQTSILNKIERLLKPININTNQISKFSVVRSVTYILFHNLGCSSINNFIKFNKNLSDIEKKELSNLGIRTGVQYYYFPHFMKKESIELRAILWKVYNKYSKNFLYALPENGRVFFKVNIDIPDSYWLAIGYITINKIAIRVDIYERFFFMVRKKNRYGTFVQHPDLMNLIGCNSITLRMIMKFLNYKSVLMGNSQLIFVENKNNNKIKHTGLKNDGKKTIINRSEKSKQKSFGSLGAYFNK